MRKNAHAFGLKWLWYVMAAVMVVAMVVPNQAVAAEEVVRSIQFENGSSVSLTVEHSTVQLKLLAEVDGLSMKKDVTDEAYWVSSNSSTVKVEKGLLTPLAKGTSRITAKYKGFSVSLDASADYLYKEVRLSASEGMNLDLGSAEVTLDAFAVDHDGTVNQINDLATWTSSDSKVATVSKGKLTLVGEGTATLRAKYKGLSDSVEIRVRSPYKLMRITPSADLEMMVGGEEIRLSALAELKDSGSSENVTEKAVWTSSNTGIVKVEKGKLTAEGSGTAKITASYLGVSTEVQVISRLPYQALLLAPKDDLELFRGDAAVQIKAMVVGDDGSRIDITSDADWSSSNAFAVTAVRGLVTPKDTGNATINVKYRGLSAQFRATVFPTLSSMKLEKSEVTLFKDEVKEVPEVIGTTLAEQTYDYTAIAEWSSDQPDIVKVEKGKLTAGKPGKAEVTARIRGFSQKLEVTVKEKVLHLEPSVKVYSLVSGQESALPTVKALMEDGTEETVTDKIVWKTSSPELLLKPAAVKGLKSAKVTLTGTYLNKTLTIPVTIEEALEKLALETETFELYAKQTKLIKVTGTYADGKTASLASRMTWTSSDDKVVSVKGTSIKAVAVGTAEVSGTYQGKEIKLQVKVLPKLLRLEASEKSLQLKAGETGRVSVLAVYDNGESQDITQEAEWTSSSMVTAKVDDGRITALKKGSASLKAKYKGKTVTVRVTVK